MAPDDAEVDDLEKLRERVYAGYSKLSASETRWKDRQKVLEARGYMLRPRFHPDWVPSWKKDPSLNPMDCEDGIDLPLVYNLIDATRVADGTLVYIKRVETASKELDIALLLSTEELRQDPRNHSVPILDHFLDPDDSSIQYMVMPYLFPIDRPQFRVVSEVIDFIDQMLVGLTFMHEQGVAHRDCADKNVMMDAARLYPRGFHPTRPIALPDGFHDAVVLPRSHAKIKYYYIDFGISSHIPPGTPLDSPDRLVTGNEGLDKSLPELKYSGPYDPFKADIYILGNLFRTQFSEEYSNLAFLDPLVLSMTATDPKARSNAVQALKQWRKISRRALWLFPAWRVRSRKEPTVRRLLRDIAHTAQIPSWVYHRAELHVNDLFGRSQGAK